MFLVCIRSKSELPRDFAIQIAGASNNRHEQNHVVKDRELLADSVLKVSGCDSMWVSQRFLHKQAILIDLNMAIHEQLPTSRGVLVEPPMT